MNIIDYLISLIKDLFHKPTGVILPTAMGSAEIYTPTISMDGNWLPFLSTPFETQYKTFDQANCVSKSGLHCVEAILNYFYKNKLFPVQEMYDLIEKGDFLNEKGFVDLSERFTAKMAGTTHYGLAMDAFWQSINRDGIVPQSIYDDPPGSFTWEDYYSEVPENIKAIGRSAAKIFQFTWTVIQNNNWYAPVIAGLQANLTHSPIHFAGSSCPKDYAGIQRPCGSKVYAHARCLYGISDYLNMLDQYPPYLTKSSLDYPIPCAIVASLTIS